MVGVLIGFQLMMEQRVRSTRFNAPGLVIASNGFAENGWITLSFLQLGPSTPEWWDLQSCMAARIPNMHGKTNEIESLLDAIWLSSSITHVFGSADFPLTFFFPIVFFTMPSLSHLCFALSPFFRCAFRVSIWSHGLGRWLVNSCHMCGLFW